MDKLGLNMNNKPIANPIKSIRRICQVFRAISFDHSHTPIKVTLRLSNAQVRSDAKYKAVKKPITRNMAVKTLVLSMTSYWPKG